MPSLNICSSTQKLIDIIKKIPPLSGFTHKFNDIVSHKDILIIITNHIPKKYLDNSKYILCSSKPELLSSENLTKLYDLWPQPLTPALINFHFKKLQTRIKYEIENTSEHKEYQKRIIEMASQDYLTGLSTRWKLHEFLTTEAQAQEIITCIYLDLDNFKAVNDTYGHQAGDQALAATAEMMQNEFPDGFCARMGGDEFMIVLTGKNDINFVENRVNKFMSNLLNFYAATKTMKALSVSAGISQADANSEKSIDQIIHEADSALYSAKNSGKSKSMIYSAIITD